MLREKSSETQSKVSNEKLREVLKQIRKDARQQQLGRVHFERYWGYLQTILRTYGNLSAINRSAICLTEQSAEEIYWSDLALIQVIFRALRSHWDSQQNKFPFTFWYDRFEDSLYRWYEPTGQTAESIESWISSSLESIEALSATIETPENVSTAPSKNTRKVLGEFYTPLQIAEHLAANVWQDNWMQCQYAVVDPAVGNGSLLGALQRYTILKTQARGLSHREMFQRMLEGFYGFDVQPAAVILSRMRLILGILVMLRKLSMDDQIVGSGLFPNIRLLDPLAEPEAYWLSGGQFDGIIANPPFLRLSSQQVPFLHKYADGVYGHPNLYQLFLLWAIRASKPGGRLAFLLPQSFRAGLYFHKLRQEMATQTDLLDVTLFMSRTSLFSGVDSSLMTIGLQKRHLAPMLEEKRVVTLRVSANGDNLKTASALVIDRDRVFRPYHAGPVWYISNDLVDYDILDKVYNNSVRLEGMKDRFQIGNGGFVWNQHKNILRAQAEQDAFPLISAACVQPFNFHFPITRLVDEERQFVAATSTLSEPQHTGVFVLIKRTTPKKRGRRIASALIGSDFCREYRTFFVENHLNFIKALCAEESKYLGGLVGWLNSRLLNFVFQMMNGTSHVSVSELQLLPMPSFQMLARLHEPTQQITHASETRRALLQEQLDQLVYELLDLSENERRRVDTRIP